MAHTEGDFSQPTVDRPEMSEILERLAEEDEVTHKQTIKRINQLQSALLLTWIGLAEMLTDGYTLSTEELRQEVAKILLAGLKEVK